MKKFAKAVFVAATLAAAPIAASPASAAPLAAASEPVPYGCYYIFNFLYCVDVPLQ